jgi:pyroglutamyl-peptidase
MSEIVVTGFEAFGAHATNPSAALARALGERSGCVGEVLPVSHARATPHIESLIASHRPRGLVLLGLCAEARGIRLERLARNADESRKPDNDGVVHCGRPIVPSGPASYESSLPLGELATLAADRGVAVEWSRDAGGFLCNHVFYRACHEMVSAGSDASCGLIHVPPVSVLALDRQRVMLEAFLALLGETFTLT